MGPHTDPATAAAPVLSTADRLDRAESKAEVLVEALPWIRRFAGTVMVVKYGGAAMNSPPPNSPSSTTLSSSPASAYTSSSSTATALRSTFCPEVKLQIWWMWGGRRNLGENDG